MKNDEWGVAAGVEKAARGGSKPPPYDVAVAAKKALPWESSRDSG